MEHTDTKDYEDRLHGKTIQELISEVQEESHEEKKFSANELVNAYEKGLKAGHNKQNEDLKKLTLNNIRNSFKVAITLYKALSKVDEYKITSIYIKVVGTDLFQLMFVNDEVLELDDKIFFYRFTDSLKKSMLNFSEFRVNISIIEGTKSFNKQSLIDDDYIKLL